MAVKALQQMVPGRPLCARPCVRAMRQSWSQGVTSQPQDLGLPWGLSGAEYACNAGDVANTGLIPGSGSSPWRRKQQPTPVLLPGKSHGQRSLAGYQPRVLKELDTTQELNNKQQGFLIFLSKKSHGQRSLAGYSPWGRKRVEQT